MIPKSTIIDYCQNKRMGYLEGHFWMELMHKNGYRQSFCKTCKRWKYKVELCAIAEVVKDEHK